MLIELFIKSSRLGSNSTYIKVFYNFTSVVFVFLPLVLLATFNCFLIQAVRRSHKMRNKMTNSAPHSVSKNRFINNLIC